MFCLLQPGFRLGKTKKLRRIWFPAEPSVANA
jgi:hypothetical protein